MEIIELNIDDLKVYENNPRNNDEAVEYVKKSIKEFGMKVPLVVDKNNVIVTGHTRLKACKELGYTKIPCIIADDLNEEQINAFRLVDNKTNEFATWDFDKLEEELMQIKDISMDDFGFFNTDEEYLKDFFDAESTLVEKEKDKTFKVIVEFEDKDEAEAFLDTCKEQELNCKMG